MAVNRLRSVLAPPRKGETYELRAGLVSQYAWERKEAIQKTIMAMTLGKDVSALFPDVLKNIATPDVAQKKLVYLYLMNYAKSHPDLCILAVNTFVQDAEDANPLVRALAIRTMGCIRVDRMLDYLDDPLRKTLRDESPYVRKTAALCVAKLFDLSPSLCIEGGFLETLQEMLADSNPMVVANALTALAEINEARPDTHALVVTSVTLKKLLLALNECTEWGRITLLAALAAYAPTDVAEAEHICERVSPQFQHANPAVVLAAVKTVFLHLAHISPTLSATYLKKMAPPLVTLVSAQPEVQYVALRNIDLLLQAHPRILDKELRVFFCKYTDPPYLKLAKLDILVRIATPATADALLAELREYALEVDMDFVRRAVRAIGHVAISTPECADKAVAVLLELVNTTNRVGYVVQEVVVVVRDVLRRYEGYEGVIPQLCQCIDDLDEPAARASLVWIVGEYADKISNADEILTGFVDGFNEEFTQTQLQILTACVKLFLKRPSTSQSLVQRVLHAATTAESDNPDLRDRAYVYWRLLSTPAQEQNSIARSVVLAQRPPIASTIPVLPEPLLRGLLPNLGTLASVYQLLPGAFLGKGRGLGLREQALEEARELAREEPIAVGAVAAALGRPAGVAGAAGTGVGAGAENLLDIDFEGGSSKGAGEGLPSISASPAAPSAALGDLMGGFSDVAAPAVPGVGPGTGLNGTSNTGSQSMMDAFAGMGMGGSANGLQALQGDDAGWGNEVRGANGNGNAKGKDDLLGLF